MAKERKRNKGEAAKLEMTPMIDVVFQLLIFFIVTLKIEDIFSHLDISRPAPDPNARPEEKVEDLLEIMIYNKARLGGDGFSLNKKKVRLTEIRRQLAKLSRYSKNISVIIKCTSDSRHSHLVQVLDVCAELGLQNLSVFSM